MAASPFGSVVAEPSHVLRWETPPPDGRTVESDRQRSAPRNYRAIAGELRQHPGEWGLVAECPGRGGANIARRIRRGITAGFRPAGAFEAECRQVDGVTRVYARYVADGSS